MPTRKPGKARTAQDSGVKRVAMLDGVPQKPEAATGVSGVTNGLAPTFEQIQRRSYELFLARGGTHGCDWADWFAAERELTASLATNSANTTS
jgi:hypothetical protein